MTQFERELIAELRRIGASLERIAGALAGTGDDGPPGVAESLTVLTNVAIDAFGLPDLPEPEQQQEKPS